MVQVDESHPFGCGGVSAGWKVSNSPQEVSDLQHGWGVACGLGVSIVSIGSSGVPLGFSAVSGGSLGWLWVVSSPWPGALEGGKKFFWGGMGSRNLLRDCPGAFGGGLRGAACAFRGG
jgi:hypothetical protein